MVIKDIEAIKVLVQTTILHSKVEFIFIYKEIE